MDGFRRGGGGRVEGTGLRQRPEGHKGALHLRLGEDQAQAPTTQHSTLTPAPRTAPSHLWEGKRTLEAPPTAPDTHGVREARGTTTLPEAVSPWK